MRIEAHAHLCLLLHHPGDSGRMTIARIGQHHLAGLKAKMPKALRRADPSGSGESEIIALQPPPTILKTNDL